MGSKIKPASLDDCKKCECGKIIAWQESKCLDCFLKSIFWKEDENTQES
jgi:hypothetical protein